MDFNKSQESLNSPILSSQAQALRWMLCVSDTILFLSTALKTLPRAESHSHWNASLASLKTRYYLHFILIFFFDRTIVPQTSRSLSSEILTRLIKDEDNQAFLPPLHQGPGRTTHTCQQRGLLYNLVLEGASFRAASDLHEASYPFSCEPSVLSSLVGARLGEAARAGCGPSLPEHPPCRGLVNSNARSSLRNSPYPLQTLT